MRDQQRKHWQQFSSTDLVGRTLLIVGVGRIGRELARIAKAFGMEVLGIKRDTHGIDAKTLHLDALHPVADLPDLLERAEVLVLCTPHTPETEGMIGAEEMGRLPRGAILINIARGAVIDEPALIDALRSGHLGAAALDVYAEEPLPEDSPLWEMDNVLVSPHSGSITDRENELITDLFCENLRRYLDGRELLNRLDPKKLY